MYLMHWRTVDDADVASFCQKERRAIELVKVAQANSTPENCAEARAALKAKMDALARLAGRPMVPCGP